MSLHSEAVRLESGAHDLVVAGKLPANAKLVLEALREEQRPIKAYGLLEKLRARGINAPMTVYRALDRLIDAGYVRKIESLNAFLALPPASHGPRALIICRECETTKVEHLDTPAQNWLASVGASLDDVYIEAFTECFGCSRGRD